MAEPTVAPTYAARREPYFIIVFKLGSAIVIFLGGFGLFIAAVSARDENAARLVGWLVAPVVWLAISAYGTYKKIPQADRSAPDLRRARTAVRAAVAVLSAAVVLAGFAIAVRVK